ncbi:MAG: hypothetical protein CMH91_03270 [Oceanicaulis sp.]|uniref:DUF819 family protein n=1 Tax=unclassified Oceanicaulis TaxID=2632123 RepID=UPI000C3B7142|nr:MULTISPECIES: DUF819 family protein [unclassified Oceanicaulis]MBC38070.1 hypothetical protein [Oceanicaulis sp.]MBG34978.1 hypothetical protein [Oceanicaulis sp.]HBU61137.1 hypothetical protein [Oceanicaulis sp.]
MIGAENIFGLMAALLGICALAAGLERTAWGRRISGAGIILLTALLAAQFGVIPRSAPLYGTIWTYLVPLAIALFLLKADLIKVFTEGGRVLIAFLAGMAGTIAGAALAALIVDLGVNEARIAGVFAATYTGGSLNFVAVAEAVGLQDSSQLSAALAIDNIFGVGFILLLNLAAGWSLFQRWYGWRADWLGERLLPVEDADAGGASLFGLLSALAVSAAAVAVSGAVSTALGIANYEMLVLTVIVTVLATLGRSVLAGLKGEDVLAMMFMYLFFAIIGAGADLGEMLQAAPGMFVMVGCIFVVHALAVLAVGRLLKLNYAEMVTASLACIAGPPIAAAIAILFKWRNLVAPGILTGILGYVLGNFAGVGLFTLLQGGAP